MPAPQRVQIVRLNSIGPPHELDPQTAFLYVPHTISALLLGLAALAYHSHVFDGGSGSGSSGGGGRGQAASASAANAEAGVWAAILVFLGYAVVQGPRTSMVRPHPAVWRLVHGILVVYVLFLVWVLFQDVDDARQFLRHLSPSLGREVTYRTYAADCRLLLPGGRVNWRALRGTLLDEFVVAHTLGWWAKALAARNHTLLWTASVGFELMELTFRHMLPNFNECWWDSWLLDVAVCNFIGIVAGMWTVRFFECRYEHYNWQGLSELPSLGAKAVRSVQQLLPHTWTKLNWMVFASPRRFLLSMVVVAIMLAFELNVFFLKYALWIPPTNPLNTARLLLWFACALPGTREYYEFMQDVCPAGERADADSERSPPPRGAAPARFTKLGIFAWLAMAMTCLETLISIKFGRGLYTAPWPRAVLRAWGAAGAGAALFMAAWAALHARLQRRARAGAAAAAIARSPRVRASAVAERARRAAWDAAGRAKDS